VYIQYVVHKQVSLHWRANFCYTLLSAKVKVKLISDSGVRVPILLALF
jgi:hypothetical protein